VLFVYLLPVFELIVYADDVNVLGGNIRCIRKNTEALVVASKKTGLEVSAEKTNYLVMSRYWNAGRSHNMKIDNNFFERVEEFRHFGTTLINQNSIEEEIKNRFNSGNACLHSVQNRLSSCLLSKSLNIKVYITIILPVVYGCGTWSLTLREECRLRIFENRVQRRIFGPKRDEVTGGEENYIMRSLMMCTPHQLLFG
jgi:hypothetical protein